MHDALGGTPWPSGADAGQTPLVSVPLNDTSFKQVKLNSQAKLGRTHQDEAEAAVDARAVAWSCIAHRVWSRRRPNAFCDDIMMRSPLH